MCVATTGVSTAPRKQASPESAVREELEGGAAPQPAHGGDRRRSRARRCPPKFTSGGDPKGPDPRATGSRGRIVLPRATAGVRPGGERVAVPHFDDQTTNTEPADGPALAPGESGAPEPAPVPAPPPAALPVPLWPPPPPEWHPHAQPPAVPGLSRFVRSAPLDVLGRPLASWLKRALAIAVDFLVLSLALSWFGHQVFPLVLSSTVRSPPEGQVMSFLGVSALVWVGYLALLGSSRTRSDDRHDALRHRSPRRRRRRSGERRASNASQRHPRRSVGNLRGCALAPLGQETAIAPRQGRAHRRGGRQACSVRGAAARGGR